MRWGVTNTTTFSILVRTIPPPELSRVQFHASGGGLNLMWAPDQGWILQQTINLAGPWQDVSTTTSSYQVIPAGPGEFYRLRLGP